MRIFQLSGESEDRITIDMFGEAWDDGWLQTSVEIRSDGFTARLNPYFEISDFQVFLKQLAELYDKLSGTASLVPMEGQLELKLTGDGIGHITAKGKAFARATYGTMLEFEFGTDQTFLPDSITTLRSFIAKNVHGGT